jgi:hypothetical protein
LAALRWACSSSRMRGRMPLCRADDTKYTGSGREEGRKEEGMEEERKKEWRKKGRRNGEKRFVQSILSYSFLLFPSHLLRRCRTRSLRRGAASSGRGRASSDTSCVHA